MHWNLKTHLQPYRFLCNLTNLLRTTHKESIFRAVYEGIRQVMAFGPPWFKSCPPGLARVSLSLSLFYSTQCLPCTDPLIFQQMLQRKMTEVWTGYRKYRGYVCQRGKMLLCGVFCAWSVSSLNKLSHNMFFFFLWVYCRFKAQVKVRTLFKNAYITRIETQFIIRDVLKNIFIFCIFQVWFHARNGSSQNPRWRKSWLWCEFISRLIKETLASCSLDKTFSVHFWRLLLSGHSSKTNGKGPDWAPDSDWSSLWEA